MFNLELLGYGFMALSTLFIGLSVAVGRKANGWLKVLLIAHGVFATFCVVAPILNAFTSVSEGTGESIGMIALTAWCIFFASTAALAFYHFRAYRLSEDGQ